VTGQTVASYGTAASTTRVVRQAPHTFHWHRTPGDSPLKASGTVPARLRDAFAEAGTESVRFAIPEPDPDGGLVQVLPDAVSIGWHLLAGTALPGRYTDVVRRVGGAVRTLHALTAPPGPHPPVPWLRGLADWLAHRPDPLARQVLREIGGHRFTRLADWAGTAASAPGGVLLGTLSPGVIVVDRRDLTAHLLVSAEAGYGTPALDLGTFAEALSTSVAVASRGAHRAPENLDYAALWDAFTAGYGELAPGAEVERAAVLRRVHRLRSISGHLGDNPVLDEQLAALPGLVDQDGSVIPRSRRN